MLRKAVVLFLFGGMLAWGQTREENSAGEKVDRADAYYHYTLARMYLERAIESRGRNPEFMSKAIENYKAAIKADPETPLLSEELAEISGKRAPRRVNPTSVPLAVPPPR